MKIRHKISKKVIDVPSDHAQILFKQDWEEDKDSVIEGKVLKVTKEDIPVFQQVEEAIKSRGRPKKNHL